MVLNYLKTNKCSRAVAELTGELAEQLCLGGAHVSAAATGFLGAALACGFFERFHLSLETLVALVHGDVVELQLLLVPDHLLLLTKHAGNVNQLLQTSHEIFIVIQYILLMIKEL